MCIRDRPTCNAWLCQHLWDRYLYSGDKEYLNSIYPIMKSASEFFVDFLVKDPNTGYMVVTPSNSPENSPKLWKGKSNLFAGVTIDVYKRQVQWSPDWMAKEMK